MHGSNDYIITFCNNNNRVQLMYYVIQPLSTLPHNAWWCDVHLTVLLLITQQPTRLFQHRNVVNASYLYIIHDIHDYWITIYVQIQVTSATWLYIVMTSRYNK